jgi:hypothetical protein
MTHYKDGEKLWQTLQLYPAWEDKL